MTDSNDAAKTAIERDYNALLRANLERVFIERDDLRHWLIRGGLAQNDLAVFDHVLPSY